GVALVLQEARNAPQHAKRPVLGAGQDDARDQWSVTKVLEHFRQEVYPFRLCWEGGLSGLPIRHLSKLNASREATWQPKLRKNRSSFILKPPTWKPISRWSSCAWWKKRPSRQPKPWAR